MRASYGVNVSALKSTSKVWSQDAMMGDAMGATMSEADTKRVTEYISTAGALFRKISSSTLKTLESEPQLAQLIEQFNNTFVRKGTIITDTRRHTVALQRWIQTKYKGEIAKRSTDKGKKAQQAKLNKIMSFFDKTNTASLIQMFELQKKIIYAKLKLINFHLRLP